MGTTSVSSDAEVSGHIATDGDVDIQGRFDGRIRGGAVRLRGDVTADVEGRTVVIEGSLVGRVRATERIEVGTAARVRGSLTAPLVDVAPGAIIEGPVDRPGTGSAEDDFEEQRTQRVPAVRVPSLPRPVSGARIRKRNTE